MQISIRYIISLFSGTLLGCALWVGMFYCQLGLPTRSSNWANELFKNKILAANQVETSKMLIVAGSSAHFGIDAEKISRKIGMPTINFGTFGGLDVEYFFHKAKEVLKPGDTVLLPIEYAYFRDYPKYTSVYVDHVIANDRALFLSWPIIDQLKIMRELPFSRLITPYKLLFSKKPQSGISVYSWFYYPYGDTHSNSRVFMLPSARQARDSAEPDMGLFQLSEKSRVWKELRSFVAWCKKRQISVIATVPNHLYFAKLNDKIVHQNLKKIKDFYASIEVPYIGDPYKAMFDRAFYFDTIYHPNEQGKELYTNYLISTIKKEAPYLVKPSSNWGVKQVARKDNLIEKALHRFNGWEPIKGFGPIFEPLPSYKVPVTAIGNSDVELQVNLFKDQKVHIITEFITSFNQEVVRISVDGKLLWHQLYAEADKSYKVELAAMLQKGKHIIKIQSDEGVSFNDYKKNYNLLFKSFLVTERKQVV